MSALPQFKEPDFDPRLCSIIDTLALKTGSDANMNDARYWAQVIDDADFWENLNADMRREILAVVASEASVRVRAVRNHLITTLEEIVLEES